MNKQERYDKILANEKTFQAASKTIELLKKSLETLNKSKLDRIQITGDEDETDEEKTVLCWPDDPIVKIIAELHNKIELLKQENKKLYKP